MKQLILIISTLLLSACSMQAPEYSPNVNNAHLLKENSVNEVSVGTFSVPESLNSISLRAMTLVSPINDSFGEYLGDALSKELMLAKAWSGISDTIVAGKLIENTLDVSGISTGDGEIKVMFTVTKMGNIVYEKEINANIQFESSFMGNVAIGNAQLSYPELVENLIHELFSDQEFINAIS